MKIDILVLNYNGKDLLSEYLPSVCLAAELSLNDCKVYVVDNCSVDGSKDLITESFPGVELCIAHENRVLCSYNDFVSRLDGDLVIFLNNDMKVEPDFIDTLAAHFNKKDIFFAAPKIMNFDGTYNGGRSYFEMKFGILKINVDYKHSDDPGETCSISTGAFRREVFVKMGGFDCLYLPGIWEDVDICYKALKMGWKGVYEPASVIWHDESTTFNREYGKKKKLILAHRNMFLFMWRNISDSKIIIPHLLFLAPRIFFSLLTGKPELVQGFLQAVKKLPMVMRGRNRDRTLFFGSGLRDRELIK